MSSAYFAEFTRSNVLIDGDPSVGHYLNNDETVSKRGYYLLASSEKKLTNVQTQLEYVIGPASKFGGRSFVKRITMVGDTGKPTIQITVLDTWKCVEVIEFLVRFMVDQDAIKAKQFINFINLNKHLIVEGNSPDDHSKEVYLVYKE